MAGTVRVAFLSDTKDLKRQLDGVENSMDDVGRTARDVGRDIDDGIGGAADGVASASSQAAGGLGDLAGALEATGLVSEGTAQAMELGATAIMGVTGAADIANLVMEKLRLTTLATTVAEKARMVAAKAAAAATKVWTGVQIAFNAVLALNPIALVIIAIIALVAAIVIAYKKSETFRAIVDGVFKALGQVIKKVWDFIEPFFVWLGGIFSQVWKGIQAAWKDPKAFFGSLGKRITGGIGNLKDTLLQKGKDVLAGLLRGARWVWDHTLLGFLINRRKAIANAIGNAASALVGKGRDFIAGLQNGIVSRYERTRDWLRGIPSRARSAVGGVGSALYQKGRDLLQGLWDGLISKWASISSWVDSKLQWLADHFPGSPIKIGPLKHPFNDGRAGKALMEMLAGGLEKGSRVLNDAFDSSLNLNAELVGAGAGEGTTINLTVNAPVGSDAASIGRELQKYLDAYFRNGGRPRAY